MASRSKKDAPEVAASQSMTQVQKAVASMDKGERERKSDEVVKYILIMDQKKIPIKKLDINKNVLKEHSKTFPVIIAEATKKLSTVFGLELKELEEKHRGSYILLNKLDTDAENNHLEWSPEDDSKMGLVTVVLSLIFMNGNVMQDGPLWNALKKLGVDPEQPHELFGDVKKLITQEFVRQCYLEIVRQPNTDPPVSEFKWGQRAKLEISKRHILDFVSDIYGIEPSAWTSQWQDAQDTEEPEVSNNRSKT